ncbi:MAG: AsmA family protein, partial [Gammaproteobacteria bacterium]|nr:AsmA family protein [Gammaproteobacteria bacterium]
MTRTVRMLFYTIASLFMLLVTSAVWIVFFFDTSKFQDPIATLVESRSGYRFSFDGPMQIDFDFDNGLVARLAFRGVSLVKIGGMTTARALEIDFLSLNLNWTQIKGMLRGEHIQGSGSFVISQMDIPTLSTELNVDWAIFNSNAFQQASGRGDFEIINNQIEVSDFQFQIGDSQVSGALVVKDWEKTPSSQFKLFIPTLDIGHYLRTDHQSFLDGFILLSLPALAVSVIDVEGLVSIGSLHSAGIVMKDVRVPIRSRDGEVVSSPVSAKLYGGSILIDTLMSREDGRAYFRSYQQITDIQIGQALADIGLTKMVEARADLTLALDFSSQDLSEGMTSADGAILLTGTNGKLKGFDLQRLIKQLTEGDNVDSS